MKRDLLPLEEVDETRETSRFFRGLKSQIQNVDLLAVMKSVGFDAERNGEHIEMHCPLHGGKDSPTVHLVAEGEKKGLFYCHSPQCKKGGFVTKLLVEGLGVSYEEALDLLGIKPTCHKTTPVDELTQRIDQILNENWLKVGVDKFTYALPNIIPTPQLLFSDYAFVYFVSRGFTHSRSIVSITDLNIRYCNDINNKKYYRRVIFPITTLGNIGVKYEFFAARSVEPNVHPKILYPYGAPTSRCFYGESELLQPKELVLDNCPLYLVEGPMDYVRMHSHGIPALCCFSAQLTNVQTTRLLRLIKLYHYQKIVIAFDGDLAGWMGGVDAAEKLAPFVKTELMKLPQDTDPCDFVDKEEFLALPRVPADSLHRKAFEPEKRA